MGKKSFVMGLLTEAVLEGAVREARNERSSSVYTAPTRRTTTTTNYIPVTPATTTRGNYSRTPISTYGCHGNSRPQFSYSYNTDDRITVSYDTAVSLFRRIAVAINTNHYSNDYARRMGRELAYVIMEGRSSGWKGDFRITMQNVRELRQVCKEFGIRVVLHGTDYEYERLFEELDRVLSSDDVRID